ncbi:MAG: ABC-F family ATP-binding cassette domain-containing protein [Anaerolineales bacterium]|nr:ABC-F family ATP-binding cassette domain-containing protein [Anaerolineales bacterium]
MAILTVSNVGQSFGAFDLFRGVTGSIPNDGKVGLVGPNGVGKTTLLRIMARETNPSAGVIHLARGATMGYLTQESSQAFNGRSHTVYQELLTVFDGLREDEAKLRQMEHEMAAGKQSDESMAAYSKLQMQFEMAGGYDYELRVQQVLTGLGFDDMTWTLPLPHLSGGQKTRVLLGRLLLEKPDLLILDEPTNHLDVQAIEWLEGMLKLWEGAILVVSHDRYFLDRVVDHIWELSHEGIQHYRGNYSAYVLQRQERWQKKQQAFDDFKAHVEKEMDYIRRNIAGQRTQMAQGKLSRLAREVAAVLAGGLDVLGALNSKGWLQITNELDIGRVATTVGELQDQIGALRPPRRPLELKMNLRAAFRSGELVLRTKDLHIGYPGTHLFTAEDIELRRLEVAALIGANGTGKSTFLRTLLEDLQPLSGSYKLGASLNIGYFAQAHDDLNLDNTVLDELLRHKHMMLSEARSYLGRFLFSQDDVFKKVSALSGGERGRLALAILALEGANFLLLDEPTNHLDIPSQEALQAALEQFGGTILMVTHDRYLVDRLASQVWALQAGRLRVFGGNYQEYLTVREQETAAAKEEAAAARASTDRSTVSRNGAQLSKNEQRRRAEALTALEHQIHETETKLHDISHNLQKATEVSAFDKIQALSAAYAETETALEGLMAQWEMLADE